MQGYAHLTVDSLCKRIPSAARLGEARIVHIGQKIGTCDIETELDSPCDAIQYCMNDIHPNICHEADKQEKETEELVEAQ